MSVHAEKLILTRFVHPFCAPKVMFVCVGMIFPLALLVGRVVHENVMARDELGNLLFKSIMAASLFWGVVIPFFNVDHSSLPLTLGIIFGVPWMILG